MISEFVESTLNGKSIGEYNQAETTSWSEKIDQTRQFLIPIKSKPISIQSRKAKLSLKEENAVITLSFS